MYYSSEMAEELWELVEWRVHSVARPSEIDEPLKQWNGSTLLLKTHDNAPLGRILDGPIMIM